jgi:hypothetical protein
MRGALLKSRSSLIFASVMLGACANIIGISSYDVDPTLDAVGEAGSAAETKGGGTSIHPGAGSPSGGDATVTPGEGGAGQGGSSGPGNQAGAPPTPGAGGNGAGGDGAGGHGPVVACESSADCDDQIVCTVDTCRIDGTCVHTADSTLCTPDPGECLTCKLGVGCTAGTTTTKQILLDADFDEVTGDWVEDIEDGAAQTYILTQDSEAHTPENSAWFGPAAEDATDQAYLDLLQEVTIPANTTQLTLTGYYEMGGGFTAPSDDFIKAGLFDVATKELEFHEWRGDDPDEYDWTSFTYTAQGTTLKKVLGKDLSFDLYGYTWDSAFYFDTLKLNVTTCN